MQHGMPVRDETPSPQIADELVTDFRRALEHAANLQASGAHEQAIMWERLAEFLRTSESYIFSGF